jgi:hypothetical protein
MEECSWTQIENMKFELKLGSIIYNLYDHPHAPGCPQFKRGYYMLTAFRLGTCSRYLNPRDQINYILVRCSKTGKLFKQDFSLMASGFDKHFAMDEYPCTIIRDGGYQDPALEKEMPLYNDGYSSHLKPMPPDMIGEKK